MIGQVETRRWFGVWLLLVVTFLFGTDLFSAENTRPIIRWIMELIFPATKGTAKIGGGEGLVRKSAHFLEYGLLAFFWMRALMGSHGWKWQHALQAFLWTILWAGVDEFQQGFISHNRTGNVWDVVLDGSGAATALTLASAYYLWRGK